jgi:hypothetical protein
LEKAVEAYNTTQQTKGDAAYNQAVGELAGLQATKTAIDGELETANR